MSHQTIKNLIPDAVKALKQSIDKAQSIVELLTELDKDDSSPQKIHHIVLVIDRSGSVETMDIDGWCTGFQTIISEQKDLASKPENKNQKIVITLCTFDDVATTYLENVNVENIPNYTKSELRKMFAPRNTTKLVDTLYECGENMITKHNEYTDKFGKDNVKSTVMTWTDGVDNCSIHSESELNSKICEWQTNDNINFMFIAANQDAIKTGKSMGFTANNCITCSATPACASAVYRTASNALGRAVSGFDPSFTQFERNTIIGAGAGAGAGGKRTRDNTTSQQSQKRKKSANPKVAHMKR